MSNSANRETKAAQLATLRALSNQIGYAIEAVERNDLEGFQNSIAEQESLCKRLSTTQFLLPPAPDEAVSTTTTLHPETHEAYAALAEVNRIYAALLKRARRHFSALLAVSQNFSKSYSSETPRPEQHTLSCEV